MSNPSRRDFLLKSGLGLGGAALGGFIPGLGHIGAATFAGVATDSQVPWNHPLP